MKTKRIIIVAAVAGVGLTALFALWGGPESRISSHAAEALVQYAHFGGGDRMRHRGWRQGHGGRRLAMLCSDRRDQHMEDALGFIESFVTFTPEQTAAWTNLTDAVQASSASIGQACADTDLANTPKNAPEKLARLETLMTVGLEVVQQVRPPFDAFYAVLSEEQQDALDRLVSRGRHRGAEPTHN